MWSRKKKSVVEFTDQTREELLEHQRDVVMPFCLLLAEGACDITSGKTQKGDSSCLRQIIRLQNAVSVWMKRPYDSTPPRLYVDKLMYEQVAPVGLMFFLSSAVSPPDTVSSFTSFRNLGKTPPPPLPRVTPPLMHGLDVRPVSLMNLRRQAVLRRAPSVCPTKSSSP